MADDKEKDGENEIKKLCANCAWRGNCQKKFSVTVANGEVRCLDYAPDMEIIAKLKEDSSQYTDKGG